MSLSTSIPKEPVKRIFELSQDELKKVTSHLVLQGTENSILHSGGRSYTPEQIVEEVRNDTEFGEKMAGDIRRSLALNELRVENGKIGIEDPDPS